MTKVVACIQARMGSSRLPGKVLQKLAGKPVLLWAIDAARWAPGVDQVVVATSNLPADDLIASKCKEWHIQCVRGSESDVLSRFMQAATETGADVILRLTGDCPFLDSQVIGAVIALQKRTNAPYASNIDPPTWPDGLDVEIFRRDVLEETHKKAVRQSDRDCVTRYMARNRAQWPSETLICPISGLEKERWVLDTLNDMMFCQKIAKELMPDWPVSYLDILGILERFPEWRKINNMHPRNERFYEGINNEPLGDYRYPRSKLGLSTSRVIIPLGAQTFSKSHVQFPGESPLFVSHGDGAYTYDVDGNEYVDLVSGLLPVILGHRDPDVDAAVRRQQSSGVSFSLATELEYQLATMIRQHIPSADMVRFGKNGSDVTTVAVRLARAHTGRDHILTSGYHGWGDAFLGDFNDRGRGVPQSVRDLSVPLKHGDAERAINEIKTCKYACVIVEPEDNPEFLQALRDICHDTGTVLIFDEIITWPRWGMSGAQGLYKITPDLTTISKAMANGYPISAICGQQRIMRLLEPPNNIFFSGTFQGETLSIAAAIACMTKLEQENVVEKITNKNAILNGKLFDLAKRYNAPVDFSFGQGLTRISFQARGRSSGNQIAAFFREVMAANGTLIINSNNLGYMHKDEELKRVVKCYDRSFAAINDALRQDGEVRTPAAASGVRDSA